METGISSISGLQVKGSLAFKDSTQFYCFNNTKQEGRQAQMVNYKKTHRLDRQVCVECTLN